MVVLCVHADRGVESYLPEDIITLRNVSRSKAQHLQPQTQARNIVSKRRIDIFF